MVISIVIEVDEIRNSMSIFHHESHKNIPLPSNMPFASQLSWSPSAHQRDNKNYSLISIHLRKIYIYSLFYHLPTAIMHSLKLIAIKQISTPDRWTNNKHKYRLGAVNSELLCAILPFERFFVVCISRWTQFQGQYWTLSFVLTPFHQLRRLNTDIRYWQAANSSGTVGLKSLSQICAVRSPMMLEECKYFHAEAQRMRDYWHRQWVINHAMPYAVV